MYGDLPDKEYPGCDECTRYTSEEIAEKIISRVVQYGVGSIAIPVLFNLAVEEFGISKDCMFDAIRNAWEAV